ncbi:MAG: ribonuclease J [Patescibacteria group bacterium]|nr:MAG: ribonuclease J [Patescibacteria group bacterium]
MDQQYVNTITQEEKERAKNTLKVITLSGTESVTKNLTVFEYGEDIILVDCGVGFPDSDLYGVDVVIPDFTYILENSHRVRGLFITHGHEDHFGAVPYLLEHLDVQIFTSKLVQGFLRERLSDKGFKHLSEKARYSLISPESGSVQAGVFRVSAFGVNHSVPDSMGLAIETPEGTVLHMPDYKIDWTPVLDKPIDLNAIAEFGKKGVLCLLSDCLNVLTEGYSKSESVLSSTFTDLFESNPGRQMFITTISSNISRMDQIMNAALKHGRKVVLSGRSIEQSVKVGRSLGLLKFSDDLFVQEKEAARYPQNELVYIIAGCYGQPESSLGRLSKGEHKDITLNKNALVIFSADPNPPGVDIAVERVMSAFTLAGAEVVYSKIQENLHVSGHGTKGDLMTIASVVKPKYFIPIGGTITRMRAYTNMLGELGVQNNRVFECLEGDIVEFSSGKAKKSGRIQTVPVYIDTADPGSTINPVVIKDRDQLSTDGVFVVIIPSRDGVLMKDKVEVITRGFIYVKASQELMDKSRKFVTKTLEKMSEKPSEWPAKKKKIENEIQEFLFKETRSSPLVIVHALNV